MILGVAQVIENPREGVLSCASAFRPGAAPSPRGALTSIRHGHEGVGIVGKPDGRADRDVVGICGISSVLRFAGDPLSCDF